MFSKIKRRFKQLNRKNNKTILVGLSNRLDFCGCGRFCVVLRQETLDVKADELGAQEQPIWIAPFADYTIAGSDSQWIALAVGVAATLLIFAVAIGAAKAIKKKKVYHNNESTPIPKRPHGRRRITRLRGRLKRQKRRHASHQPRQQNSSPSWA